ncbi:arginase [Candidatus Rhabdochlamydia porcellionis]|jgi:arginase|uniref:Arginase n=1 Tax=Candidatus Rhabdochlamydia porcellionis TaxID=225148 RepID=A0ABX8YYP6_9BACT|nr:arginase [Candidatus Rhabdochlamydia porcellionis]QZA58456.1 Formimidoylglutamase [Candidatus Rhabdochlamydia porcellionis]
MYDDLFFIGASSGLGGNQSGSEKAPFFLKNTLELKLFQEIQPFFHKRNHYESIAHFNRELAKATFAFAKKEEFFIALGGDHSCAIGTWSGVAEGYRQRGDIGLLWVDAHMDAHRPSSSKSGNIHGMPLAVLLGFGNEHLVNILSSTPKLKPQNIALIGTRSYEKEEEEFLKQLGVNIYFMENIKQRGLQEVLKEAIHHITTSTIGYGISFDLDSLDPSFADAVGTPVSCGLDLEEFLNCFVLFQEIPPFAFELVEYNPGLDTKLHSLNVIKRILSHCNTLHKKYIISL